MDSFLPADFRFDAPEWAVPAVILFVAVMLPAVWGYYRAGGGSLMLAALAARVAAVLALAFCLVQPSKRIEQPRPGANVMALLLDSSGSMQIKATGDRKSRMERIRPQLDNESAWQTRLAQDFDIRRYTFDSSLRTVGSLQGATATGNSSRLATALNTVADRFNKRPVAGVLLFTDGISQEGLEQINADLPFPVYPVVDNQEAAVHDLSIGSPSVTVSSFDLAPVTVEATMKAIGLSGETLVAQLLDASQVNIETQTFTIESEEWEKKVRFRFRPSEPGVQFASIRLRLTGEQKLEATDESKREVTLRNNTSLLAINRNSGPYRVLYVSGRPNWDLKYLRRALEEDVELQFSGLVRVAREEPKFSFRDQSIDSVNPLKAGFSDEEEEAEQYDEPVLLRLGEVGDQLQAGFPAGEEELFHYHAIIIDDLESAFFSQQQQMLIREFVSRRGGGIMMLGGVDTFTEGNYRDTPIADTLPVYLSARASPKQDLARYVPTRDGKLQPWLRLRADERLEAERLMQMPSFETWSTVGQIKPGATQFASLASDDGVLPALVGHQFGRGRGLALLLGDYWKWGLEREVGRQDDLGQSWRQIARWLTNDAPNRVEVDVEPPSSVDLPHKIVVRVFDGAFQPADNAQVQLTIRQPNEERMTIVAQPVGASVGTFAAEFWSSLDGSYLCDVRVEMPDGEILDNKQTGWTAHPTAGEFIEVSENRQLLASIAERSGGELVAVNELSQFAASLPKRRVPIMDERWEPVWHQAWMLLLTVGCLCLEWWLRRWKGLA